MIVSHLGDQVDKKNGNFYQIKEGSQVPSMRYLGLVMEKIHTEDRREICTTLSRSYIINTLDTI